MILHTIHTCGGMVEIDIRKSSHTLIYVAKCDKCGLEVSGCHERHTAVKLPLPSWGELLGWMVAFSMWFTIGWLFVEGLR